MYVHERTICGCTQHGEDLLKDDVDPFLFIY